MANADTAAIASVRLLELVGCLQREAGFAEVVESLQEGHAATLDGVWGSSCALVAAALVAHAPATLLVVCPQIEQVDELIDDLALFTRLRPARFPAAESFDRATQDEVFGERLQLLKLLPGGDAPKLVITSIQSLLQPVPSRQTLDQQTRTLGVGTTVPIDELAKWLVENNFLNTSAVDLPGEFSVRGGIVDIFAPDWDGPVRVEFFGDEIESIRRFDIANQRSLESLAAVDVTVAGPSAADRAHLTDYLPPQSWVLLLEPMELEQHGRQYLQRVEPPAKGDSYSLSGHRPKVGRERGQSRLPIAFRTPSTRCRTFCGRPSASRRLRPPPWPPARWRPPAG